ncbi:hypothetical protein DL93DRAFT_2079526 [Clavulina sp. PMI_390]|nr:hypothetical protein DL93DRAFT_2079526 [Clavulina sp. PMI_390]
MDGHEISVLMNHKVFEVIDTYYASAWERNSLVNIRLGQSGLAQNIRFDLDNVKKAIEASEDQITPALESIIFELQEAKQRGENLDDKTKHFLKAAQTQVASLALGRANVTKNKRGPARDLNVPLDLHNVSPAEVEAAKTIVRDRGRLTGQLVARVHSGLDRSGAMSAENTVGSTKPAPGVAKRHANVAGIAQRDEALGGEDEDEDEDEDNILEDEAGNENRSAGGNEASGLKQLEHDAQVFASKIAAWEAMGKPQKPNEPKTSSEFNEHAFKELVYTSSSADEIVRPQMTAGNPTAAVDIPKLRAQRNNVLIFIMHTMFELAGKELPDYLEAFWTEYMALGHCCPLCIDFTHILPGETESASKHTDKNWHHVATHIKCHSEWHDLELKMRTPDPNIFACPACGDFFTSVISTRSHCISLCPEKAYFTAMRKASEGSYSLPSKARKAPIPSFDEITERQKTHAHKVRSSKYLARALRDPALSVIHDQIESLAEGLETTQLEDLAFV